MAQYGDAWQRGGGNCWVTSTFEPDLNLLYVGTGNPWPDFDGDVRPRSLIHTSEPTRLRRSAYAVL